MKFFKFILAATIGTAIAAALYYYNERDRKKCECGPGCDCKPEGEIFSDL